ncbi:MAG: TetR/AcrR family transcriptional regulator [Gemmatimonadetes bacterium]|nr:TetR/AcrR family transcriptional regulator [Gemmatimonadota bacterium]NNF14474.1 TetR/AcrR family transcriptional regulator [Gemmatimonadota bacterium]
MASETRDRIVDSARQLFWEQGFESTTLAQIAERSEAMPGSIYYFFKTKDAILHAVIDHYDEQLGAWLIDPVFGRTDDPVERIFGVIDTYRSFLVETHFTLGCPVGGLALELGGESADARAKVSKIFDDLTSAMESCAREIAARTSTAGPSPEALAALCLTVIEGGIVQARALQSIEPFDRSVTCLRDYVDRLLAD